MDVAVIGIVMVIGLVNLGLGFAVGRWYRGLDGARTSSPAGGPSAMNGPPATAAGEDSLADDLADDFDESDDDFSAVHSADLPSAATRMFQGIVESMEQELSRFGQELSQLDAELQSQSGGSAEVCQSAVAKYRGLNESHLRRQAALIEQLEACSDGQEVAALSTRLRDAATRQAQRIEAADGRFGELRESGDPARDWEQMAEQAKHLHLVNDDLRDALEDIKWDMSQKVGA